MRHHTIASARLAWGGAVRNDLACSSRCGCAVTQTHDRAQQPATINFFMVMSVLVAGMGVVMGLPYLLFKKKDAPGTSWAQQLEDSRKKRVGHVS